MSHAKEKRKQGEDDVVTETQKKAREAVTDEEVEEFYAILRRIHRAVKYFKNIGDDVAGLEKEILKELKDSSTRNRNGKEENLNFDLNITPTIPTSPR